MLNIELKPAASEPEFSDRRLVGEWVTELPNMLAKLQNPPWCSYTARIGGQVVGLGGFKGAPDETGSVEIAYLTLQPEQRRGVANEVCAKLVVIAFESRASVVLAHTLPEDNPSTAVLRRQGFRLVGEVQDPEDGTVWQWSRRQVSD